MKLTMQFLFICSAMFTDFYLIIILITFLDNGTKQKNNFCACFSLSNRILKIIHLQDSIKFSRKIKRRLKILNATKYM